MNAEVEAIHYIVSGIGINVNQQEFPEEIRETATSLKLEGKKRGKPQQPGGETGGIF